MTLYELRDKFVNLNASGMNEIFGYITFTEDSFDTQYDTHSRTYKVSSKCKYFNPNALGNSLYGSCLDGTDNDVRLDYYIFDEFHPWKVENCYLEGGALSVS